MAEKKRGLGRGLGALMQDSQSRSAAGLDGKENAVTKTNNEAVKKSTSKITKSPLQPRREFDKNALAEPVSSIEEHGIYNHYWSQKRFRF